MSFFECLFADCTVSSRACHPSLYCQIHQRHIYRLILGRGLSNTDQLTQLCEFTQLCISHNYGITFSPLITIPNISIPTCIHVYMNQNIPILVSMISFLPVLSNDVLVFRRFIGIISVTSCSLSSFVLLVLNSHHVTLV